VKAFLKVLAKMAFEVARVHQLICSRVGDDVDWRASKQENASVEAGRALYSPVGTKLYPRDLSHTFSSFDGGCDASSLPSELSSVSTETESDEEDDLLQSLAQQIAHSMLDDESKTEKLAVGGGGSGYSDSRNVEVNEGRLSPSSWSSGSWSSGSVLSGSRNSSKGSSRVSSQVSSPSASSAGYQDAWGTLYAAAGEVVRLKMNEERKVAVHPIERPTPSKVMNSNLRAQVSKEARPSGQMAGRRSPHTARRKDENLMYMTQAQQNWASKCAAMNAMATQNQPHYNQYQQHQQVYSVEGQQGVNTFYHQGKVADSKTLQRNRQTVFNGGSGVRVVFLGASAGRESGTGVFLPRTFEPKKKTDASSLNGPAHGCATGARHARNPREGVWPTLQQSMNRSTLRQPTVSHEPCLPTEWTY